MAIADDVRLLAARYGRQLGNKSITGLGLSFS